MAVRNGPSCLSRDGLRQQKGRHEAGLFEAMQTLSIPRTDRATPAEAIVHADLDGMFVVAEAGADDLGGVPRGRGVGEGVGFVLRLVGPRRGGPVFETPP